MSSDLPAVWKTTQSLLRIQQSSFDIWKFLTIHRITQLNPCLKNMPLKSWPNSEVCDTLLSTGWNPSTQTLSSLRALPWRENYFYWNNLCVPKRTIYLTVDFPTAAVCVCVWGCPKSELNFICMAILQASVCFNLHLSHLWGCNLQD